MSLKLYDLEFLSLISPILNLEFMSSKYLILNFCLHLISSNIILWGKACGSLQCSLSQRSLIWTSSNLIHVKGCANEFMEF